MYEVEILLLLAVMIFCLAEIAYFSILVLSLTFGRKFLHRPRRVELALLCFGFATGGLLVAGPLIYFWMSLNEIFSSGYGARNEVALLVIPVVAIASTVLLAISLVLFCQGLERPVERRTVPATGAQPAKEPWDD